VKKQSGFLGGHTLNESEAFDIFKIKPVGPKCPSTISGQVEVVMKIKQMPIAFPHFDPFYWTFCK